MKYDSLTLLSYLLVPVLIITFFVNLLPQNFSGNYFNDLKGSFVNDFIDKGEGIASNGKYDISSSGFGSYGKLGGSVKLDDSVVLRVKSSKPYYLRAVVKDIYDGFSWKNTKEKMSMKADTNDSININYNFDFVENDDSITISPESFTSTSMFLPSFVYEVHVPKGNVFYNSIPTFLSTDSSLKNYTAKFLNMKSTIEMNNTKFINGIMQLSQAEKEINKKYLQVPDNISKEIKSLVLSITKNSYNEEDAVSKLREYLMTEYNYSLEVSDVPNGREFIDYFLNTEKKGYCVYFATTMTMFCRIAGIPARYVEGFKMNGETSEDGQYEVANKDAHAWTEILTIPNQQIWETVDATPASQNSETVVPSPTTTPTITPTPTSTPTVQKIEPTNPQNPEKSNLLSLYLIPKWILVLILFLGIIVLFIIFRVFYKKIKMSRILNHKSAIPLYKYYTKKLKQLGIIKENHIPDMEFADKITDIELRTKLKEIVYLVYLEVYGSKELPEYDSKKYYNFLENYLKENQKKIKYYLKNNF